MPDRYPQDERGPYPRPQAPDGGGRQCHPGWPWILWRPSGLYAGKRRLPQCLGVYGVSGVNKLTTNDIYDLRRLIFNESFI
jgi:hypothetical protein